MGIGEMQDLGIAPVESRLEGAVTRTFGCSVNHSA